MAKNDVHNFPELGRDPDMREQIDALREMEREYEEMAKALHDTEERFSGLFESVPDSVVIFDREWHYAMVNPAAVRALGHSAEELRRTTLLELFPKVEQAVFFRAYKGVMETRQPDTVINEYTFANGEKRWYEVYVYPAPEGILTISVNITERKRMENALKARETLLSSTVASVPAILFATDKEGIITLAEGRELQIVGINAEDVIGQHASAAVSEQSHIARNVGRALNGEEVFEMVGVEGGWTFETYYVPIRDNGGSITGVSGLALNVTERQDFQRMLEKREDLLRRIFEAIPDPTLLWERQPDGKIVLRRFNTAAYWMSQGNIVNLEGMEVLAFFENYPAAAARIKRTLRTGETLRVEHPYKLRTTGEYKYLIADYVRVSEDHVLNIVRDVTKQYEMQESLRQSEERLRLMIENAQDIIAMHDAEGRYLYYNGPSEYGVTGEDLVGKSPLDLFPEEQARPLIEQARQVIETGESITEQNAVQWEGKTLWFSDQIYPIRNAQGEITAVGKICRNITAIKQAEDALRESEEKFRSIIEQSSDGIVIIDEEGAIIEWNAAMEEIMGIPQEESIGQPLWDVQFSLGLDGQRTPEAYEQLKAMIQNALQDRSAPWFGQFQEKAVRRSDGETRIVQSTAFPIEVDDSFMIGSISRDVTEIRKAEKEAMQLAMEARRAEVLEEFIKDASHDINTPITTIQNSLYILKRLASAPKSIEKCQEYVEIISNQTRHLSRILEDMLSMVRLEKTSELKLKPFNLDAMMRYVTAGQQNTAVSKGHKLTLHTEEFPALIGDEIYLSRAVTNLITNAINFSPPGSEIAVDIYGRGEDVVIQVADNGIGISEEDIPHIFDRFFKSDPARSSEKGGTGLGLPITKKIVEAHGGTIEVESALGKGSTFRLVLPLKSAPVL